VLFGGDCIQDAGMQRKGFAEPGDAESLQDPRGIGHQRERSAADPEHLAAGHQGTQAGRVQESNPAQVRDDVNSSVIGKLDHPLAELRGGVGVDLAFEPQHGTVAARGDGLQVKRPHATSIAGLVVLVSVSSAPMPPVLLAVPGHRPARRVLLCARQVNTLSIGNRRRTARRYILVARQSRLDRSAPPDRHYGSCLPRGRWPQFHADQRQVDEHLR
jgi:hypothetical protein